MSFDREYGIGDTKNGMHVLKDRYSITKNGMRVALETPLLLSLILLCMVLVPDVAAHLAGRQGVDNYVCITPAEDGLRVMHDVHLGEIPAAALMARLDGNRDGHVAMTEMAPYFEKAAMVYADGFEISVSSAARQTNLSLSLPGKRPEENCDPRIVEGKDGASTFRYTWNFRSDWPEFIKDAKDFRIVLKRHSGGLLEASWQFAYGQSANGLQVLRSNIPDSQARPLPPDITETIEDADEIPSDSFAELIVARDASIVADCSEGYLTKGRESSASESESASDDAPQQGREIMLRKRIMEMARSADSGWTYALLAMLCFIWGAMHAFAPGHGKAIAGTYLISAKASYVHAAILGLLMTMTHTAVILILAAAATILKDKFVYPTWLQTVGAVLILLVGLRQIYAGLRKFLVPVSGSHSRHGHSHSHIHRHDHHHHERSSLSHSHSDAVTAKDIGALGLSGGMVPCPAAIVLLLLTWQLGRPGFGFVLIVAFSIGLAATLISVACLAIFGTKFILRWISKPNSENDQRAIATSIVPVIGGVLLLIFGTIILLG